MNYFILITLCFIFNSRISNDNWSQFRGASGDGTASITVDWGAAGAGSLSVTAVHACGSALPVTLPVTKYNVITSIASGNFNTPATWDCNCDPPDYSNIVVDSGHVVTMTANEIVNNLTINEAGTLDNGTARIDIYGNYTINGDHTGSGGTGSDRIYLYGDGTYIDGTGTISHPSRIRIWNNHKTILATADIKLS